MNLLKMLLIISAPLATPFLLPPCPLSSNFLQFQGATGFAPGLSVWQTCERNAGIHFRASNLALRAKKEPKKKRGFGKTPEKRTEPIEIDSSDSLTPEQLADALIHFAGEYEDVLMGSSMVDSTDDRGLSAAELARERVLCSRLGGLQLRRTRISSEGAVAGTGLFATRDIAAGELITCYPCDALIYSIPGSDDSGVIFGAHVPEELADVGRCFDSWVDYGLFEDDDYAVIAIPNLPQDVAYAGHFCNDGAMLSLNAGEAAAEEEAAVGAYEAASAKRCNAMHEDLAGLHMVTVATRRIACGEEVLTSYGVDYWRAFAQRRLERGQLE